LGAAVLHSGYCLARAGGARPARAWYLRWLDVLLGALLLGLLGARVGHVLLDWPYFAENTAEILQVGAGGLNWHGGLAGALVGAVVMARARRVPLPRLFDALALGLPFMAAALWRACMDAACGYGLEVRTLADYPPWLAAELPNLYGDIAPRLNLPVVGILFAALLGLLVLALAAARRVSGLRLWLILFALGSGMAVISAFRDDYVPLWFGRRADQVLDVLVALGAAGAGVGVVAARIIASRMDNAPAQRIDFPVKNG
jgi:phosphatidylglycerol:prolipoprotein diacylglycerol transferase